MSNPVREMHQCQCAICATASDERVVRYHRHINLRLSRLNEPQRRWYVGVLSQEPDSPGDVQLSLISGVDEKTIHRGRQALHSDLMDVPLERERHGVADDGCLKKRPNASARLDGIGRAAYRG